MEEEIEFEISGAEAVQAVIPVASDTESTEFQLKAALNSFAKFLKAVPPAAIRSLSPGARRLVSQFFLEQARLFSEVPDAQADPYPR